MYSLQIEQQIEPFKTIEIDTTMKLLKKLKRLFYNRVVLGEILKDVKQRELHTSLLRDKIRSILDTEEITSIKIGKRY